MATYIPAANIIGTKVLAPPDLCIFETKSERHTKAYLSYNYGTEEEPNIDCPLFKLQITKGIIKINHRGKPKLHLYLNNTSDINGLSQLSLGFVHCVDKYKDKFNLRNFNPEHLGDLRGAFYYPMNEDGEVIPNTSARIDLKIGYQTVFQIPTSDGYTGIDIKMLIGRKILCSVIIHPNYLICYGGTPQPEIYVRSCIILDIIEKIEDCHAEDEDIKQYIHKNTAKLANMQNLLVKLSSKYRLQLQSMSLIPVEEKNQQ
jgi:hypothetical protein